MEVQDRMEAMGEKLKLSRFNIPVTPTTATACSGLFNTATGNYIALTPDLVVPYERMLTGESVPPAAAGLLYTAGFAVEDDLDEVAALRYAFDLSRTRRTSPHLTIAPTLACNFGCAYCFEQHVRGQMQPDVQDRLIAFVNQVMVQKGDHLSVSWFGGEPLMGMAVIRRLSTRFLEMLQAGEIAGYFANVVTNGFFLKSEVAKELLALGVKSAQITIDGPRHIHDRRRVLKGSDGATFDTIIGNIRRLPEELQLVVRVNVDRENKTSVPNLLEELEEAGVLGRVVVNVAKVEDFSGRHEPPAGLLSATEFAKLQVELFRKAQARGWPLHVSMPAARLTGVCQVDSINSFVVTPTGELLKCWAELGNNGHVVGNLLDSETWQKLRPTRLTQRDPFDDEECTSCVLLPTCMGCCPLLRQNNRESGRKVCPPFKHNFSEILRFHFGSETRIVKKIRPFTDEEDKSPHSPPPESPVEQSAKQPTASRHERPPGRRIPLNY